MTAEWSATYRLQLHSRFPLSAAEGLLPYLAEFGISHVYLSPCLQAVPGSEHGYDVVDPTRLSEDLGGEAAWQAFCRRARECGLGILLDIVPNHMATHPANPWWDDLLAHGLYSRHLEYFDVTRFHGDSRWQVHLATLGEPYGTVLENRGFTIDLEPDRPRLRCGPQHWPLTPASWNRLLPPQLASSPVFEELRQLDAVNPPAESTRAAYEQQVAAVLSLWAQADPAKLRETADSLQADPDRMHDLLRQQWYALHGWKLAGEIANYRRFFDVGSLVGMRMEHPSVFDDSHQRIAAMISAGEIQGLRVDHPDGLRTPLNYFQRLRSLLPDGRIYVEKILENDERLRESWPVDGTVGYDFLNRVNRLWMREEKSDALSALYSDFTGHTVNLPRVVREKKLQIIESHFNADLDRLTDLALTIARSSWQTFDLSRRDLRAAFMELTVLLPVYRTYLGEQETAGENDRQLLERAMAAAANRAGPPGPEVYDFINRVLTADHPDERGQDLIARWQQLTPAVAAKGVEDTAFYCYDRLVSCNEVGSQPSLLGISSESFHEFCHHLSERWPHTLLATSTHDNKRSEDVRARLSVLTEDTERWGEALQAWTRINQPAWKGRAPDRHAEYLLYQTLVGAWPIDEERVSRYMLKACREAKIHTSWHAPDDAYEGSIREFIQGMFASDEFMQALSAFVEPLILPGRINSLAQTLIKMTAVGVPDFYQGSELWDLSLVDPDNRRPVDFECRRALLERARNCPAAEALADWDSGLPKLWLIARVLTLRRERPDLFCDDCHYQPVTAYGTRLGHLLSFLRGSDMLTVVPRFTFTLQGDWGDTRLPLPAGEWRNVFTGDTCSGEISPPVLFNPFPVALLTRSS